MNLKEITDQLRGATHDKLLVLADWCRSEATKRDPSRLKELADLAKWQEQRRLKLIEEENNANRLVASLKAFLKPGMKLKMRGCKDGTGIREFIKWDGNSLVCWQIIRRRSFVAGNPRAPRVEEFNTNQVTTHMANKVQEIYVNGTGLCVKSILN